MPRSEESAFRLEISGDWSALDFAVVLGDLALLYDIRSGLDRRHPRDFPGVGHILWWLRRRYPEQPFRWWESPWQWPSRHEDELDVRRVRFESPGFVDLAGIGKVVEQLRLFIEKLIDLKATRRREGLENEALAQDIEAKKIENARNFLRLAGEARDMGLSDDELRYLLYEVDAAQERLLRQVERRRITAVTPIASGDER